jgi:hypothetical protein
MVKAVEHGYRRHRAVTKAVGGDLVSESNERSVVGGAFVPSWQDPSTLTLPIEMGLRVI